MIEINHVSFTYKDAVNGSAIKDISVKIPKGQAVLLCGESGSGKTTFSRLINGLVPAYYKGNLNGNIIVEGRETCETELYELAPMVGSVFQNPKAQFYTLITDTEIVFACENIGIDRESILKRFDDTVNALHMENLIGKSLFALSGGEKQKIACASVYALTPDILVLDEPTSNLDIKTIQDLKEILRKWKAQGKTIIIAEHRLAWLGNIVDRILYFKNGMLTEDFDKNTFFMKTPSELHDMGLRAEYDFVPQCKCIPTEGRVIEISNFYYSIKGKELLNVKHLSIPKGAIIAILGNNGAGKTSFARCLCGLLKKAEGVLLMEGKRYGNKQRTNLCYMVMQDVNHQLFTESVIDEVRLGTDTPNNKSGMAFIEEILKGLDLLDYKDEHPMALSGGQRQRVAVASAIASYKEIIVFDEPTSGLDYRHMEEVADNILKLSTLGKTIFIITHDPELVAACCNYFIFLEKGMVTRYGGWDSKNIEFVSNYFQ